MCSSDLSDVYLDFLAASIRDALEKTGMDGFMIDWVWMPDGLSDARKASGGKWLDAEKALFAQIMGAPFPGEDALDAAQKLEYDRKSLDRCWARIRDAAKAAKPDCIIWLSCCNLEHPSVQGTALLREADWLMNEHPDPAKFAAMPGAADTQRRIQ